MRAEGGGRKGVSPMASPTTSQLDCQTHCFHRCDELCAPTVLSSSWNHSTAHCRRRDKCDLRKVHTDTCIQMTLGSATCFWGRVWELKSRMRQDMNLTYNLSKLQAQKCTQSEWYAGMFPICLPKPCPLHPTSPKNPKTLINEESHDYSSEQWIRKLVEVLWSVQRELGDLEEKSSQAQGLTRTEQGSSSIKNSQHGWM